jgi:hypothetical protein
MCPPDGRRRKLSRSRSADFPLPGGPTTNNRDLAPTSNVTSDGRAPDDVGDRTTSLIVATLSPNACCAAGARVVDIRLKISDLDGDPF